MYCLTTERATNYTGQNNYLSCIVGNLRSPGACVSFFGHNHASGVGNGKFELYLWLNSCSGTEDFFWGGGNERNCAHFSDRELTTQHLGTKTIIYSES